MTHGLLEIWWRVLATLALWWICHLRGIEADCPLDTFPCGNGDCIDKRFVCDSVVDCRRVLGEIEGRDELYCSEHENYCLSKNFRFLPDSSLFRLIDTGYDIVKGGFANVRMFQSERYTGGCRTVERFLKNGSKINYRLPHNLINWTFFDEKIDMVPNFRAQVYKSASDAFEDLKQRKSVLFVNETTTYKDLYFNLTGQFDVDIRNSLSLPLYELGFPLVRIYSQIVTGSYKLKPPNDLALHTDLFLPYFLDSIELAVDEPRNETLAEKSFGDLFRRSGTHYVSGGNFGGAYETYVYRGDCDIFLTENDSKTKMIITPLAIEDIARCAHALIQRSSAYDKDQLSWNITECKNVTKALPSKIGPRKYDIFAKAFVSGGAPEYEKALETSAILMDIPAIVEKKNLFSWMASLNDYPAPTNLQLTPICDLISSDLSPLWENAKQSCDKALLKYVGVDNAKKCSKNCMNGCTLSKNVHCFSERSSFGSCPYVLINCVEGMFGAVSKCTLLYALLFLICIT